ncbi:T9SS type A sorting domain-containing protein [Bacteroidales bacterium OttesenSCG-928-B11]|nr:T9SS type A sorting domain-containing protein [Bacteroidales bacterium OttesenSCG-928-B11]MDL2326796.1 T9SS type A sorting domain-containing protein [Bacteroidales bacterium OttesenSCG-928-A14]
MRKILLFAAVLMATFSTVAQQERFNFEPTRNHTPQMEHRDNARIESEPPHPKSTLPHHSQRLVKGDWWEPDTILIYSTVSTKRWIYRYDENLRVINESKEELSASNEWIKYSKESSWEYDEFGNRVVQILTSYIDGEVRSKTKMEYEYNSSQKLITETWLRWISATNVWSNLQRMQYEYNSNNDMEKYNSFIWEDNDWKNSYRTEYTYNTQHELISSLAQSCVDGQWINSAFYNYTYDVSNNKTSELYQLWDSTGQWNNSYLITYTYDANNNLLTQQYKNWEWHNNQLTTNAYNNNNELISKTNIYYSDTIWSASSREIWEYDQEGRNTIYTKMSGINSGTEWRVERIHTYMYDGEENLISDLEQGDNDYNISFTTYTYDSQNNRTGSKIQKWEWVMIDDVEGHSTWVDAYQFLDTYDEHGNCILGTAEKWNSENETWEATDDHYLMFHYNNNNSELDPMETCYKFIVSYTTTQPNSIPEMKTINISLFPNPAQSTITISTTETIRNIELYNLSGQLLGTYNQTVINVSHLPAGVYFVKITMENGSVTRKVVKG